MNTKEFIFIEGKKTATFSLTDETIKKLNQITIQEIIATGKSRSKSEVLRGLIINHYNNLFNNGKELK